MNTRPQTYPHAAHLPMVAALALTSAALGQADYSAFIQTRTLSARADLGGGSTLAGAGCVGPGAYIDSVTAVRTVQSGPNQFVTTTSTASLVSDVEAGFIDLYGTFSHTIGVLAGSGGARERISCDISFQLTSPYIYTLSTAVGIPGMSPPGDPVYRDVWLNGPGGYSVAPGSQFFAGVLAPGVYTLHADVESRSNGWDTPSFHVRLEFPVIPAPAPASLLGAAGLIAMRRRRRTIAASF